MSHVIAMSGLRGCLPDFVCAHFDTPDAAAEGMREMFDLSDRLTLQLGNTGWVDEGSAEFRGSGAEYIELIGCNCATPEVHCAE